MRTKRTGRARWIAAGIVALLASQPAAAFYFRGWPAGPPDPPTLLPPDRTTRRADPPLRGNDPPKVVPDPTGRHPDPVPGDGGEPPPDTPVTPEPGTALLAGLGLGVAALFRRSCKRRGEGVKG